MGFTARSQPIKRFQRRVFIRTEDNMHVAHTPFCVWMPCCKHPFLCVDSVLHTPLSMCAFRVAHIPFYVCIPCYTHPFLCVHSVLHPFLCVHSVLHLFLCVHSVLHPFLCVHSLLCAVDCPLQDSGWSCQTYYKKEDCGKKGYVKDPMFCPILCGVCPGELCILSHPLWSVSR